MLERGSGQLVEVEQKQELHKSINRDKSIIIVVPCWIRRTLTDRFGILN